MKSETNNKGSGLTRRQFITVTAGAVGLTALASSSLISVLGHKASAADPKAAAADNKKKHRSWCMVIDLKKCEGCTTINQPPQCTANPSVSRQR